MNARGDDRALVNLQAAGADQAGAKRHDQGMHAKDADADAVQQADQQGGDQADQHGCGGVVAGRLGRGDEGSHGGSGADAEVDAAGEHDQGLTPGHQCEGDGEFHCVGQPSGVQDAGAEDLQGKDQQKQQQDQGDQRMVLDKPLQPGGGGGEGGHGGVPRVAR